MKKNKGQKNQRRQTFKEEKMPEKRTRENVTTVTVKMVRGAVRVQWPDNGPKREAELLGPS